MRPTPRTIWMPTRRRAGISAHLGWSASVGYVRLGRVDGVQPLSVTLKEGET